MRTPPIYIITFAGESMRKTYMAQQMQQLGLDYTFVDAVDGQALTDEKISLEYDAMLARQSEYGELNRGEIGCALSHKKIWQYLAQSPHTGCVILEDDALLASTTPAILSALQKIVKPGDFVCLSQSNINAFAWLQKKIVEDYRLVYINQAFIGAVGYYISKEAAQRFLKCIPKIYFPIDFWYQTPGFKGVTAIKAVVPPLIKAMPFDSTIGARGKNNKVTLSTVSLKKHFFLYKKFRYLRLMLKNRYFLWPVRR